MWMYEFMHMCANKFFVENIGGGNDLHTQEKHEYFKRR